MTTETSATPNNALAQRLTKVVSIFKPCVGEGTLVQLWMPMKMGPKHILTTYGQPNMYDEVLADYRQRSRTFSFPAREDQDSALELPGRVFTSGRPEWTSNVAHYTQNEYLRLQHAKGNKVRGLLAMPIFDLDDNTCCGVLEVATVRKKTNFDREMSILCILLQDVHLMTTAPQKVQPKHISMDKENALVDIFEVLQMVCQLHGLPLAMTWIPGDYSDMVIDDFSRKCLREKNIVCIHKETCYLCSHKEICYVNDKSMEGFLKACTEHYLKEGEGIAGRALESIEPYFSPDVKNYDIKDYPLVVHAREYSLNAALAIRMRSSYTGMDDYILEFFLPINCRRSSDQLNLVREISSTMQMVSKNLRTVSYAELVGTYTY